jgi:hypothetical protein
MRVSCRLVAITLYVLAVAACAPVGPTLYGPETNDYGYKETKLENGEWKISFTGNHLTERQAIENYALYRAAQIAGKHGIAQFVVIDRIYERDTRRTYAYRSNPSRYISETGRGGGAHHLGPSQTSRLVRTERRTATIVIRPYNAPSDRPAVAIEAPARVIERLEPGIQSRGAGNQDTVLPR